MSQILTNLMARQNKIANTAGNVIICTLLQKSRWLVLLVLLAVPGVSVNAAQDKGKGTKYAFLVGCSEYLKTEFRALPYTGNDVDGFRQALLVTGFDAANVVTMHDGAKERRYLPEKARIIQELDMLLDGMRPEDTLVVALSGHGLQFKGEGVSYFVPVDGKVDNKNTLIRLDGKGGLYERIKACKAKRKLLIVNACRNDPTVNLDFATNKIELVDEDREEVPEGIALIYACQAGQKSYFDEKRKRALFFDHLIRAWKGEYTKGEVVTLEQVFAEVKIKTKMDANKTLGVKQIPFIKQEYKGEWQVCMRELKKDEHRDWTPNDMAKPAKQPTNIVNTTWKGKENLGKYDRLDFHLGANGNATMWDEDNWQKGLAGNWSQNGNEITLRFYNNTVVYRARINGNTFAGTATNGTKQWDFALIYSPPAQAKKLSDANKSIWSGKENLEGFDRLTFRMMANGQASMWDESSWDNGLNGSWSRVGGDIVLRFYDGTVVYRGQINGNTFSGTASNGTKQWQFSVEFIP